MTANNRPVTMLSTPSDREIVITRVFNAPCRLVFEAWTTPAHVRHWYGPADLTLSVCEIDLRPGGSYRYVLRDAAGQDYAFSGVYHEVVPHVRLVYTDRFEGVPGPGALVTVTFEEHDGKTTLTSRSLYPTVEARDAHIRSGMEQGMRDTLDRLEEHLQTLA